MIALLLPMALAAPADDFAAGNTALAGGDLAAAEAAYRQVLDAGVVDADVYFNLGNVLFREKQAAGAILAWRRSAALAPRDPDPDANLDFARRTTRDKLDVTDAHPWFAPWQVALTGDEALWLGGLLAGVGLLAIAARRTAPSVPLPGLGVAGLALGALVGAGGFAQERLSPPAVVLAEEVTATSDLGGGVDLFTLHAGAEVDTVGEAAGKVQLRLPDGRRGWVPAEAVGLVDPSRPFPVL